MLVLLFALVALVPQRPRCSVPVGRRSRLSPLNPTRRAAMPVVQGCPDYALIR
jgi:hypothetical protein